MTSKPSGPPTPRPPETTIAASVSSGRAPFSSCHAVHDLRGGGRSAERHSHVAACTGRRGGLGGGRVRAHSDDRSSLRDLGLHDRRTTEDRLRGDKVGADTDRVGDHTAVRLDRQTPGDLLAFGARGDEHRGRRLLGDELREQFGLRGHDVPGQVVGVRYVDVRRTVLGQGGRRIVDAVTDEHRGGLTQRARERQQFEGGLLHRAVDVVDEYQDFSHCFVLPR
jgi:hypothetical protein